MTEMIDIPAAAVTLLDKLPKVRVLPYEGVEMIRIRYAAAKGAEKALLGDVLRLLEGEV